MHITITLEEAKRVILDHVNQHLLPRDLGVTEDDIKQTCDGNGVIIGFDISIGLLHPINEEMNNAT